MDPRAAQAREAHRLALEADANASVFRARRDAFVRSLHEDEWSYSRIARAVGISKELVAYILTRKTGGKVPTTEP